MDLGSGLLGPFARSGSIWLEEVGRRLAVLDGPVEGHRLIWRYVDTAGLDHALLRDRQDRHCRGPYRACGPAQRCEEASFWIPILRR